MQFYKLSENLIIEPVKKVEIPYEDTTIQDSAKIMADAEKMAAERFVDSNGFDWNQPVCKT